MSEMKLPLTLEITSPAGCDAVISKELTGSIHPRSPWWAGSFKGCSGFQLIPCALSVGPVPWLLHLALSKEIRPSGCACLCLLPPQYPQASLMSTVPAPDILPSPSSLLCSLIPVSFSCDSLSCSMHSSLLFLWPSPPLPTTTGFHIWSACPSCLFFFFFSPSSPFHISPLTQDCVFLVSCLPILEHLSCF